MKRQVVFSIWCDFKKAERQLFQAEEVASGWHIKGTGKRPVRGWGTGIKSSVVGYEELEGTAKSQGVWILL